MAPQSAEDVNLEEMRLGGMSDARESGEGRMDEVVRGGREAEAFRNSLVLTRDTRTQHGGIKWLRSKAKLYFIPMRFQGALKELTT